MPRYSDRYLDSLFDGSAYQDLAMLQGILTTAPSFDLRQPDYGLAPPFFVVVEGLAWFAQAWRSGVWTYFEATPPARQQAMYEALLDLAPAEFAQRYQVGMSHWRNTRSMEPLDAWMKETNDAASDWMRALLRAHRTEYKTLCA